MRQQFPFARGDDKENSCYDNHTKCCLPHLQCHTILFLYMTLFKRIFYNLGQLYVSVRTIFCYCSILLYSTAQNSITNLKTVQYFLYNDFIHVKILYISVYCTVLFCIVLYGIAGQEENHHNP